MKGRFTTIFVFLIGFAIDRAATEKAVAEAATDPCSLTSRDVCCIAFAIFKGSED